MQSAPPTMVPRSTPARPHAGRRSRRDRSAPIRRNRSSSEVTQLFIRYQRDGDLAARGKLVDQFLPLARMLARRYEHGSDSFDDVFQVACLGLLKAVDRFDAGLGNEFSSYAVPSIVGEIRRHFRDSSWALHVPRSMQERVLALAAAMDRLSSDVGASPTPERIAAELDLTVEEVLETMLAAAGNHTVSLDALARPHADDETTVAEAVGEPDASYELVEARPGVAKGLTQLPERERSILYLRFAEELTQTEIGQRLGISQMHVSRLLRQSLDRLRTLAGPV